MDLLKKENRKKRITKKRFNVAVFLMAMLGVVHLIIFNYLPMFGVVIAFKDMDYVLNITKGIRESSFLGFDNFLAFINDRLFKNIMSNTVILNTVKLLITFPVPILFAIVLTELKSNPFRKSIQTITYFPYFISWAIYGGIIIGVLATDGVVNHLLLKAGLQDRAVSYLTDPKYFWWIVILSDILKGTGWSAVIYVAAISAIDPTIYDSAAIDGANRFQKSIYITLPSITGTIVVLLLLSIAGILNSNFDQFYVLQNQLNLSASEVIDTYIYKVGLSQRRYSYVTAVGLFKSAISLVLLVGSNRAAKKIAGRGLF